MSPRARERERESNERNCVFDDEVRDSGGHPRRFTATIKPPKIFPPSGGEILFFSPPSPFPAQYRVNLLDFQSKFAARFTGGNTCAVEIVFNEFCVIYRLSYYNFRGEIEGEGWTRPIDG